MLKKISFFLAIGIVAVASKDAPFVHPDCKASANPNQPIHLPYPNDCTKFYKCNGVYAHQMDCQPGLHWSQQNQLCDYPENANCDPNVVVQPGQGVIVNHPDCDPNEDPMNPTHLPYPGDCTKFYKCNKGNAHPIDCPSNLHWNIEKDYCDYPGLAKCDPSLVFIRAAGDSPQLNPKCPLNEDPNNPTLIPYPGNCERFQICNAGYAVPMDCPSGLHWDDTEKICNWPLSANCRK